MQFIEHYIEKHYTETEKRSGCMGTEWLLVYQLVNLMVL